MVAVFVLSGPMISWDKLASELREFLYLEHICSQGFTQIWEEVTVFVYTRGLSFTFVDTMIFHD